jgi:two-component system OmpR family sensor kinase
VRITSVRTRLILWNVGVLSLVLVAFGAAVRQAYENKLIAGVDQELRHHSHHVVGEWMRTGTLSLFPPPPLPRSDGERTPGERGPGEWRPGQRGPGFMGGDRPPPLMPPFPFPPRLLSPAGKSVGGPPSEGPWDPGAFTLALQGAEVYSTTQALDQPVRILSVPLIPDGKMMGVMQIVFPLNDVHEELGRLTRTLLTVSPLALLAAALGGALLTDRALRPVRQITQAAAQIGASDLSDRLPVKGHDEFSELAATFNGMLSRLEQAFTQLAQALEQQQRFTADASHELRTPLTIIKANTSLALEEERSNVEYRRALEAADRAADTTNRIVQDLLLLARGDVGQLGVDRRPIRIGEILQRATEPFRTDGSRLPVPGFQPGTEHRAPGTLLPPPISIDLSDPSLAVAADPHHLVRLFGNLLENAVRHTPPTGHITVSAHDEEDSVVVRVEDTGEGIAPEHLPHVCERFYRVDAARTRRHGGTGLGLAICQSIVEAHHGSLTLESIVGEGTTVTVRLPGPASVTWDDAALPTGEAIAIDHLVSTQTPVARERGA